MRHRHRMPFGAEAETEGTRFRLWAPDAGTVELRIEGPERERCIPLTRDPDGWYEATLADAGPGTLYRYRIDGGTLVPDPASRHQPDDVHGPSEVVDPEAYVWENDAWRGRPWHEAVLYELHVGTFTPEGTYRAAVSHLDELVELGITAIELMPVNDFPGRRGWGYDGVLWFAPDSAYGTPDDLKALIDAAHGKGLMVFLDVVYNHFGPEGNYVHAYAEHFFNRRHKTPWGPAVNYDGDGSAAVRDVVVHNVLYWLEEYRFDGLRFDAVHAICDESEPHILEEIAARVRATVGEDRQIHLVLENDANQAHLLERDYAAQWNDDIHHAWHALLTGEDGGYYADYADDPLGHLVRCLGQGLAWQGEPSAFRHGKPRGEKSGHLPPTAFVAFLQNHDQIGNRAFGDRLGGLTAPEALRAATAVLLLSPQPPLLFMGQEWGAATPFRFFCDLGPELADAVREGRRREFRSFPQFRSKKAREAIPDPLAVDTFAASRLMRTDRHRPEHAQWWALHRHLLTLRHDHLTPRLGPGTHCLGAARTGRHSLRVAWGLADGATLTLQANLSPRARSKTEDEPPGRRLHLTGHLTANGALGPWTVAAYLETRGGGHA